MRKRTTGSGFRLWTVLLLLVLALMLSVPARADLIFDISNTPLSANPGDTVIFTGQITNTTGLTLNASDMFFNFSGYDPIAFSDVSQLLGNPDFILLDHHISPIVDLFSVTVSSTAAFGTYSLDVSLQDINNDSSPVVTGTVNVGAAAVPEPSSIVLLVTSLIGMVLISVINRHTKYWRRDRAVNDHLWF